MIEKFVIRCSVFILLLTYGQDSFSQSNPKVIDSLKLSNPESDVNKRKKKVVYGELFGAGIYDALSYDVRLSNRLKGDGLGFRIGVGNFGAFYFPIQINYLIGGRKDYLEVASGVTIGSSNFDLNYGTYGSPIFNVSSSIAYRHQPSNKGFFLRVSGVLFYQLNLDEFDRNDKGVTPWAGVGLGYSFR